MSLRRAVFLDRDGVINRQILVNGQPGMLASVEEFEWLPGARDSLERLRRTDLILVVVTNQPDVARGRLPMAALSKIHDAMSAVFRFDGIYVCPHVDADGCDCRKPKPGMILRAAREHGVDPSASFLVGDRARDIEAGRNAGCTTILIRHSYTGSVTADEEAGDLAQAADIILRLIRSPRTSLG